MKRSIPPGVGVRGPIAGAIVSHPRTCAESPTSGSRAAVGLRPYSPQLDAGERILPPNRATLSVHLLEETRDKKIIKKERNERKVGKQQGDFFFEGKNYRMKIKKKVKK